MGVEIRNCQLYCNTANQSFGPLFKSYDEGEAFIRYCFRSNYGDPRKHAGNPAHLEDLQKEFRLELVAGALELPLLFHGGSPWDDEKAAKWEAITGSKEATSKVMCDHLRLALEVVGELK